MRGFARMAWRALVSIVLWRNPWMRRRARRPAEADGASAARAKALLARGGRQRGQGGHEGGHQGGRGGWQPGLGGGGGDAEDPEERRIVATTPTELLVALCLLAAMVGGGCFAALYALHPNTQYLGIAMGSCLLFLAAAAILAGKALVPQETTVEERAELEDPEVLEEVADRVGGGAEGITRRRLLVAAAGAAGTGVTAAVALPIAGLGPGITNQLFPTKSPWQAGVRLVDEENNPIPAAGIRIGSFMAAFPEGANKEELDSPVALVRVYPSELHLPAARSNWAPEGILAYSKICTHAGCAISLFRTPLAPSTVSRPPALVCPCHYSTFNVLQAAHVEFGPAGRPLPQLPLMIDSEGNLRARGRMSGPVGPSWFEDPR